MKFWLASGAAGAFLAVAMGAFAAHGLEARLPPRSLEWIDTGAHYGLLHGLALVAVALLGAGTGRLGRWPKLCLALAGAGFAFGSLAFSATLYVMALADNPALAVLVPFGGTGFLLGWAALFVGALAGLTRE